ncbi:DoxX family protein [Nocardiopsis salina]|uniref:DoxX family protein n=1 Tax=Nocardiopsis salina TaxID=245836 RepID=UPI000347AB3E|nr:DoxX family protein [Nocardiopsis salina]
MPAAHARRRPPFLRGQGRLYDAVALLTRIGVGWAFTTHALGLRGRESELSELASGTALAPLGSTAPVLPALLVATSIAFAVGLLTWVSGPLLAVAVLLGHLAPDGTGFAPFAAWSTSALVVAVCLLMAAGPGRWSWDHLVLGPPPREPERTGQHDRTAPRPDTSPVSRRRPEHAPPLLYPVGQAEFRRP